MTDDAHRDEPSKRLFFALDCPPAQRKAIAQWRAELGLRTGKPVPADNFHLTPLFLGAVPLAQIGEVCEAAGNVRTPGEHFGSHLDACRSCNAAGGWRWGRIRDRQPLWR